jgi:acetyl-CoA acetyltransferase
MTELSRASGRTELELAVEACRAALTDARERGADALDSGGHGTGARTALLSYHMGDSAPVTAVAAELGIEPLGWHNEIYGGGTQCASILGDAAMLIDTGLADTVLIYRALNGRSGTRMNTAGLRLPHEAEFLTPYGMAGPVLQAALAAQRYLYDRKLRQEHLGMVVAASRKKAANNGRALRRKAEEYRDSPMVADPLRRADCCQETDGGCALVVTRAERAPDAPRVHAVVRGGRALRMDRAMDVTEIFSAHVAGPLYAAAGMTARDIDVALLYDAYSWMVPRQLEDFGFCAPGEVADRLPELLDLVNPHGGLLSEGYVHGLNNVAEAVRQLRGDGTNQRPGARGALCTGFGGGYGSAAILLRP